MRNFLFLAIFASLVGCGAHRVENDPKAEAELKQIQAHLSTVKSLQFEYTLSGSMDDGSGASTVKILDPTHIKIISMKRCVYGNGESIFTTHPLDKTFYRGSAVRLANNSVRLFWGFSNLESYNVKPSRLSAYYGDHKDTPILFRHIEYESPNMSERLDIFYSVKDRIPLGAKFHTDGSGIETSDTEIHYTNVQLDPALDAKEFVYSPPKDYTQLSDPSSISSLKVGGSLPPIKLVGLDKKPISTDSLLKARKGLLVFFWSHG